MGLAIRSLLETVAYQHIISRRGYLPNPAPLRQAYADAATLVRKLQSLRKTLAPQQTWLREELAEYNDEDG